MRDASCPDCQRLTAGDCGKHGTTWYPFPPFCVTSPSNICPAVCPGAGTIATDLQGLTIAANIPTEGNCGICKQRVGVDGYQRCVVHPYKVPDER